MHWLNWLKRNLAYVGAGLTAIYVIVIVALGFQAEPPLTYNEWGDYFAGFMSPVALAWLIGTLFIQRQELALQRQEMAEARVVAKEQAEEQRRTAEANLQANLISEGIATRDLAAEYKSRLKQLEGHAVKTVMMSPRDYRKKLYESLDKHLKSSPTLKNNNKTYLTEVEFCHDNIELDVTEKFSNTLNLILQFGRQYSIIEIYGESEIFDGIDYNQWNVAKYLRKYVDIFDEFYGRAQKTGGLILVDDRDEKLAQAIRRHLKTNKEDAVE